MIVYEKLVTLPSRLRSEQHHNIFVIATLNMVVRVVMNGITIPRDVDQQYNVAYYVWVSVYFNYVT